MDGGVPLIISTVKISEELACVRLGMSKSVDVLVT